MVGARGKEVMRKSNFALIYRTIAPCLVTDWFLPGEWVSVDNVQLQPGMLIGP
jgi:hypothetical protein